MNTEEMPIVDFVLKNYKNFNARATPRMIIGKMATIRAGKK